MEEILKREIMEEVGVELYDDTEYIESKAFVADDGKPIVDVSFCVDIRVENQGV